MRPIWNASICTVVVLLNFASTDAHASAISVELAKKCRELSLKAFPPKPAGSRTGDAAAQRQYFGKCIANKGVSPADNSNANEPAGTVPPH
jgi:hypothetical protein